MCHRFPALCLTVALMAACASATTESQSPPAGNLHDNLELLADVPKDVFDQEMQFYERALGVDCLHCHIQLEWDLDDVPAKDRAREMIRMERAVGAAHFDDAPAPTCWTCHRGETAPEVEQPERPPPPRYSANPFSQEEGRAAEIYENVQLLGDLTSAGLKDVMEGYNAALGVACTHCHVVNDWASDRKREKDVARRMVRMETEIEVQYFQDADKVSCWTCHRGEVEPDREFPAGLVPDL